MKKLSTAKKIGVAVLGLSAVGVGMQIQSAQAQYGYGGFPSGAPTTMTASGGYLFVMRGDVLYKIRQKDLKVEQRLLFNGDPGLFGTPMPYPTATSTFYYGEGIPTATSSATLGATSVLPPLPAPQ